MKKAHLCSETAIQFYFQISTFAKKFGNWMFYMTFLKLLN